MNLYEFQILERAVERASQLSVEEFRMWWIAEITATEKHVSIYSIYQGVSGEAGNSVFSFTWQHLYDALRKFRKEDEVT